MRRIMSKEKEAKRQKKNQTILVAFLVLILFGSTFGIIVNSFNNTTDANKIKYNGKEFVYQNGFWVFSYNGGNFGFVYNPEETGNLIYEKNALDGITNYQSVPVYIYSENSDANLEIYRNIFQIAQRVQEACPEGKTCGNDVPVKDCTERFIIIEESDKNEITQDNKCVYIKGSSENLIKLSDEFLFNVLGVKDGN